jgi:DamX protein
VEALSLCCAPFENRFDPKFFYATTALTQHLELLTHLSQFGEPVVVVSGPRGSGKTTLLDRFVAQAGEQWDLCLLNGGAIDPFPVRLARALEVEDSAEELAVVTAWAAQADASQLLLLAIDDAERLDHQACRRLLRLLAQPHGDRVKILLFGNQDIEQRITQALEVQGDGRGIQRLEVPRLSPEETASYLMYRLAAAGYNGESPFTTTEVRGMCKAADGRPAAINRLADDALREHQLRASSRQPRATPVRRKGQGRLWASVLLGVMAVGVYVAWQRLSTPLDLTRDLPELARLSEDSEIPLILPPAAEDVRPAAPSAAPPPWLKKTTVASLGAHEPSVPGGGASRPTPVSTEPDTEDPARAVTGEPAQPEPWRTGPWLSGVQAPSPAPPTPGSAEPDGKDPAVQAAASAGSRAPASGAEIATARPESHAVPPELAAAPGAPSQPPATEQANAPHREQWLLEQPADLYSLQLLGSRNQKSVVRFIEEHNLDPSKTAYYQGSFKDSEWFVLLYGLYPSREAAIEASQALPAALRKNKPWPRSLESVHSAIRELAP